MSVSVNIDSAPASMGNRVGVGFDLVKVMS